MQMTISRQPCSARLILAGFAALSLLFSNLVSAQVSVKKDGHEVNIGSSNEVSNETGGIADNVEIEGVAIINDKVYIDGVRVPKGVRKVTSSKTGKTYLINWGKDGNITVTEK